MPQVCAHFCYKMLHCGILVWCNVGFVTWVSCHLGTIVIVWLTWKTHQYHCLCNRLRTYSCIVLGNLVFFVISVLPVSLLYPVYLIIIWDLLSGLLSFLTTLFVFCFILQKAESTGSNQPLQDLGNLPATCSASASKAACPSDKPPTVPTQVSSDSPASQDLFPSPASETSLPIFTGHCQHPSELPVYPEFLRERSGKGVRNKITGGIVICNLKFYDHSIVYRESYLSIIM